MPIKSEDGLTHGWDQSDPTEWHPATDPSDIYPGDVGSQLLGLIALIIIGAAALIALFRGIESAPIVIPGMLIGAIVYALHITSKRKDQR